MISLDGSQGGGQILRTALAFSMITQKPFTITNIRAQRPTPGLKPQHSSCIKALQQLSDSKASTTKPGATEVTFIPAQLRPQDITIDIQTAGSITLLLQSLIIPIIETTKKPVTLTIIGGTDVKWSPPSDYYVNTLLPAIQHLANISMNIVTRGYYPKGGGVVKVTLHPKKQCPPSFNMSCQDEFLGDQLLPFLAITGGSLRVPKHTNHILSNIYTIEKFCSKKFTINENCISYG